MKKTKYTAFVCVLSLCLSLQALGCSSDSSDNSGNDNTQSSVIEDPSSDASGNNTETPSEERAANSTLTVTASSDKTLTEDTVYGDFTVLASSTKSVTVSKGGYFDLGGGADYAVTDSEGNISLKAPSYRAIKFYAWAGDTVTVSVNSNADDRYIYLSDGVSIIAQGSAPKTKTTFTAEITASGTYYLFSPSKGIKIYSVTVANSSITDSNDSDTGDDTVVVIPVTSAQKSDFAGSIAETTLQVASSYANGIGMASNLNAIDTSKISNAIYASTEDEFVEAISNVEAGGAIVLTSPSYNFTSPVVISYGNNGTSSAYKYIVPATGTDVVLDFSGMTLAGSNRGVILDGNYWHIYGITIKGAGDNGMLLSGNCNIIENVVLRDNRDSGLQVSRYRTDCATVDTWPSDNLILNCTSFNNCDESGENADGFAAKLTCGNNVFDGCISYSNSDDGWDLFAKAETGSIGVITLRNCIAFKNGYLLGNTTTGEGDMNGFKLGGHGGGSDGCVPTNHKVYNCIAFNNGAGGFTDNGNGGALTLLDCTAYNSVKGNYIFSRTNGGYFKNLITYGGSGNSFKSGCTTVNINETDDFISAVDIEPSETIHTDYRNSDGTINISGYLETKAGSAYEDCGAHFGTQAANVYKVTLTY